MDAASSLPKSTGRNNRGAGTTPGRHMIEMRSGSNRFPRDPGATVADTMCQRAVGHYCPSQRRNTKPRSSACECDSDRLTCLGTRFGVSRLGGDRGDDATWSSACTTEAGEYLLEKTVSVPTKIRPDEETVIGRFVKLGTDGLLEVGDGYAWDGPSGRPSTPRTS